MKAIAVVGILGLALTGACHVKESNEQTVIGTIAGVLFKAVDAHATQGASPAGNPPQQTFTTAVFVSDVQGECGLGSVPGGTTIEVIVTRTSAPVSSGTYGADGGTDGVLVTALLQRLDVAGRPVDVETATSGSITMDIVEPSEVRGSLSLAFPRGSVSGTFVAPFSCAGDDAGRPDADGGHADAREMADVGPADACSRRGDTGVTCEP